MLNITMIAVGKMRSWTKEAEGEYAKRLKPYAKLNIVEVEAESFRDDSGSKIKAKKKEGERILAHLSRYPEADIMLLRESGKQFSSLEFARFLIGRNNHLILVLAGALGFSEEIVKKYPKSLSLSLMTFPHEMARVVLLEQIYRAATILQKKTYHY